MSEKRGPSLERFQGCLLGLAVGDALGMPLEGMRASEIRKRFGRVRDFLAAPWRMLDAGQWTDDTKMMLCQARSIAARGGFDLEDTAQAFLAWYESGDWRGIGGATYDAMRRLQAGAPARESGMRGEMAAGNGAAMRIAPLGLLHCLDLARLRADVEASARITHDNPEAVAGGLAVAYAVARAARGDLEPSSLIGDTTAFIGDSRVAERLELAQRFLRQGMESEEALARLGTGGYVVETVASAFFSFLRSPEDFEETLSRAVGGGLDTDTTGAVAGAISGAFNGLSSIPERWRRGVEAAEEILDLAARIHALIGP
ncbi:MAG: ADP-ribosylglycohydrolase family protein [Actinobacteria bacterium]|nr:ADP-ribosylglycohydrolase family protein [Actinomycetota bacterium]MDI6830999.1 ADP-ribosylglycohydrolase family protein [Actinomycetota bacterium]